MVLPRDVGEREVGAVALCVTLRALDPPLTIRVWYEDLAVKGNQQLAIF